jgi:hypothetical protein
MSVVIRAEKVVTGDNRRYFRINELKALKTNKLPKAYINPEIEHMYLSNHEKALYTSFNNMGYFLVEDSFYEKKDFYEKLAFIKKAGENLRRINKEIEEKRKNWQGEVEFII